MTKRTAPLHEPIVQPPGEKIIYVPWSTRMMPRYLVDKMRVLKALRSQGTNEVAMHQILKEALDIGIPILEAKVGLAPPIYEKTKKE